MGGAFSNLTWGQGTFYVNIRSCVRGSTEHRNLSTLPERSARGAAEGTTRGQRAKVSMRGRTEDAASNWLRIFPKQTFYRVFENIQTIHLGFQLINGGEEFSCNGNQRKIACSIT